MAEVVVEGANVLGVGTVGDRVVEVIVLDSSIEGADYGGGWSIGSQRVRR